MHQSLKCTRSSRRLPPPTRPAPTAYPPCIARSRPEHAPRGVDPLSWRVRPPISSCLCSGSSSSSSIFAGRSTCTITQMRSKPRRAALITADKHARRSRPLRFAWRYTLHTAARQLFLPTRCTLRGVCARGCVRRTEGRSPPLHVLADISSDFRFRQWSGCLPLEQRRGEHEKAPLGTGVPCPALPLRFLTRYSSLRPRTRQLEALSPHAEGKHPRHTRRGTSSPNPWRWGPVPARQG